MKTQGQHITIERDDRDFLLDLGRQHGVSRILGANSMDHLIEQFRPPMSEGLTLPWDDAKDQVRFMPGKVSVWSGPTFAGKTQALRHLMLHAITRTNRRALFISLEEEPDDVWREFTCMAAMSRNPTMEQRVAARQVFDNKLWVFDSEEPIEPTVLFGMVRFAVEKFGFSQIVIDSLMRLHIRKDDFDGQREMGNTLGRLARKSRAHIHLVVHPRKAGNSREEMDLYDIGGAQEIVAQADSVFTLERMHKAAVGEPTNNLKAWKQRGDVNWIGKIPLHYCARSRQLKLRLYDEPIRYLPDSTYDETQLAKPARAQELDDEFDFPEIPA